MKLYPSHIVVSLAHCQRQHIKQAQSKGATAIELRYDLIQEVDLIAETITYIHKLGLTSIITIRTDSEGGQWSGNNDAYFAKLQQVIACKPTYIDVEVQRLNQEYWSQIQPQIGHSQLLLSYHNFDKTPSLQELSQIMQQMQQYPVAIRKIATMVAIAADLTTLTQLLIQNQTGRVAIIAMGQLGRIMRFYAPYLGSTLNFVTLSTSTAPGQLTIDEFNALKSQFLQPMA